MKIGDVTTLLDVTSQTLRNWTYRRYLDAIVEKEGYYRFRSSEVLRGLFSHLSSVQNKLFTLQFNSVVFGTKQLFRERILRKISKDEFRIRRDSSFCCMGKK